MCVCVSKHKQTNIQFVDNIRISLSLFRNKKKK